MKTFNKIIFLLVILISSKIKAQTDTNIIYYDVTPDYVVSAYLDTFKVDINNDGLNDIKFYMFQTSLKLPFVSNLHSNASYAFFAPERNDSLSTDLFWRSSPSQYLIGAPELDSIRVAVRLINGLDYYYGWIRVRFDKTSPPEPIITIKEYAFCKIANYPFLFGQTDLGTSVNELNIDNNTQVYFNSSSANIVVQSDKQLKEVKIINMLGATVKTVNNINNLNTNISTTSLAHGNYIVQVRFKDASVYAVQVAF